MNSVKNLTVAELVPLLKERSVKLIDVRTTAEVARGFIEGAEIIPLHVLPMRIAELDLNAPTVFYCQIGGRSAQAAAFAIKQGMQNVYNLQGGIVAWSHFGGEITL